ncbi:MAG: pentapeptide repeat-containing protein, partial [Caldilineaceae bacterium]|nr:pentapeptide repeat-containing protein [Caldilineaceae bacterium]
NTNLKGADLFNANLEGAVLVWADLTESILVWAKHEEANFTEATLTGVKWSEKELGEWEMALRMQATRG